MVRCLALPVSINDEASVGRCGQDHSAETVSRTVPGKPPLWRAADHLQRVVGERYELVRELGRGGFGVVWEAANRASGNRCAIKFLKPEYGHGFPLVRFKREFRTARRLRHPSCVRVYEIGHAHDIWHFSMELVSGTSLRQADWIRGDVSATVAVALQILAALDDLHGRAVIHRDIKPHNILVGAPGGAADAPVARVTDFGIAKVGDFDDDEGPRALRGSPPYLAPELLIHGVADARCDLYSLGVTLYECLAGVHPLRGGRTTTLSEWLTYVKEREPAPLDTVAPEVPAAVARAVMRLMAKDPTERYRTAAHAYQDLAQWWSEQPARPRLPDLPALTGGPYLAAPRLIGRDPECRVIEEFLTGNLKATGRPATPPLLLLGGAAGVGKTRLLSWLLSESSRQGDLAVLVGHCRSEIGGPLEGVARIIDGLRASTQNAPPIGSTTASDSRRNDATMTAAKPSSVQREMSQGETKHYQGMAEGLTGGLGLASAHTSRPSDAQGLRQLLHALTEQLLAAVQGRPTLIVIEDLQWADFETLELLKLWARSISIDRAEGRPLPVALVATHRPAASTSDLGDLRRELVQEKRAEAIDLESFGPSSVEALAAELLMQLIDDRLRRACAVLFEGRPATPLYVAQVLRLLLGRGYLTAPGQRWDGSWTLERIDDQARLLIPDTVEGAIGAQAARLSVETKALVSLAAVFGRRFGLAGLCRASPLDPDLVQECLEEAERAGFVADDAGAEADGDGAFLFTHDRYREALYDALPEPQKARLHADVAGALRGASTGRARALAADLAHHYRAAALHEDAYRYGVLAGERALRGNQYSRASELFAGAIDSAELLQRRVPRRVIERCADAAALALHVDRAEAAYRQVLAQTRDPTRAVLLRMKLAQLYDRAHQGARALREYSVAVRMALPWHMRTVPAQWCWLILCTIGILLSVRFQAFSHVLLARLSRQRREALCECAATGTIRAFMHGDALTGLRIGFNMILSGLSLRDARDKHHYAFACGGLQLVCALYGLDRHVAAWRRFAEGGQVERWSDRGRCVYYIMSSHGASLIANQHAAAVDADKAMAAAMALRDPLLIEMAGSTVGTAWRWYGHFDQPLAAARHLSRFAAAENLPTLQVAAGIDSVKLYWAAGQPDRVLEALADIDAAATAVDGNDALNGVAVKCMSLQARIALGVGSETLVADTIALLRVIRRKRVVNPFGSLAAHALVCGMMACDHLGTPPRELVAEVARLRHRAPLIHRWGRWRRPQWLGACAIYDARNGKHRRAERALAAALAECRRYSMGASEFIILRAGQQLFPADSTFRQRCIQALSTAHAPAPQAIVRTPL
jgi:serine/threonine protein kinase